MTTAEIEPTPRPGPGLVQERVALVTGGTRGIGAAICRELAHRARTGQIWAVNGGLDM